MRILNNALAMADRFKHPRQGPRNRQDCAAEYEPMAGRSVFSPSACVLWRGEHNQAMNPREAKSPLRAAMHGAGAVPLPVGMGRAAAVEEHPTVHVGHRPRSALAFGMFSRPPPVRS